MNDLISRALALEAINAVKGVTWSQSGKVLCGKMFSQIKDLPAVDAAPVVHASDMVNVVRCKDCKHRDVSGYYPVCKFDSADPYEASRNAEDDDWFCADGERRDGNG